MCMAALNLTKRDVLVKLEPEAAASASGTNDGNVAVPIASSTWECDKNLALQALHATLLQQHHQQHLLHASLASSAAGLWNTPLDMTSALNKELEEQIAMFVSEAGSYAVGGSVDSLLQEGRCKWPECSAVLDGSASLTAHLQKYHSISVNTLVAAKLQLQIVRHLEQQVMSESARLANMLVHLKNCKTPNLACTTTESSQMSRTPAQTFLNGLLSATPSLNSAKPGSLNRHRSTSIDVKPFSTGSSYSSLNMGLNISDVTKNRSFYRKSNNIRPPFTYAALIRQAILESSNRQLTLNEIYQWFQTEFAFFRRNEATWKNAVRHNLSLHKCFMRVENVKGAVWTVDDSEFLRRRPQRLVGTLSTTSPDHTVALVKEDPLCSMSAAAAAESDAQIFAAEAAGNHMSVFPQADTDRSSPTSVAFPDSNDSMSGAYYSPTSPASGEAIQIPLNFPMNTATASYRDQIHLNGVEPTLLSMPLIATVAE